MQEEELKENILREPGATYGSKAGLPKNYINPFEDWAFKKIFASETSKEVTKAFLNAVLAGKRKIVSIELGTNEYPGEIKSEGGVVFDFICTDVSGVKFLVEVQRQKQQFFKERSLFYASRLISDQSTKGDKEWKYNLKEVYSISLLEEFCLPDTDSDKYIHEVSLCNIETGAIFYDKLKFFYIEVMKFDKKENELETELENWLYYLKNISKMTEEPQFLKTSELKQFVYLANYANLTDEERARHRAIQKVKWDNKNVMDYAIESGIENGIENRIHKYSVGLAREFLAAGVSMAEVLKCTKLSEEEILADK